jgi:hypothetical protein
MPRRRRLPRQRPQLPPVAGVPLRRRPPCRRGRRYSSSTTEGSRRGSPPRPTRRCCTRAETWSLPGPAIAGGWPDLALSETPDGWATEFASGLLDIDFAHQSCGALGAWLVAEEAPDLLPGIPSTFSNRALYVSLLEPAIIGQPSPVPSPGQWRADAAAGVRWSASDLEVQLDPQWQQMIDAGWQPPDIRAAVEDVSGVLTITRRSVSTKRRFSLVIQVGSGRWRDGYGTVLVSDWTVYSR